MHLSGIHNGSSSRYVSQLLACLTAASMSDSAASMSYSSSSMSDSAASMSDSAASMSDLF